MIPAWSKRSTSCHGGPNDRLVVRHRVVVRWLLNVSQGDDKKDDKIEANKANIGRTGTVGNDAGI